MTLISEDTCPWQALINTAHDKWIAHDDEVMETKEGKCWSFANVLDNCSPAERAAMILGKLNYQVENGGFSQWIDNRYAAPSIDWLRRNLLEMGPVSQQVLELVERATTIMNDDGELDEWSEEDHERVMDVSDEISSKFYELEDEWHKEVYAFLAKY